MYNIVLCIVKVCISITPARDGCHFPRFNPTTVADHLTRSIEPTHHISPIMVDLLNVASKAFRLPVDYLNKLASGISIAGMGVFL